MTKCQIAKMMFNFCCRRWNFVCGVSARFTCELHSVPLWVISSCPFMFFLPCYHVFNTTKVMFMNRPTDTNGNNGTAIGAWCFEVRHKNPLTDKLVTCSGFTAISKGAHKVYHKLLVTVNPEQYHYTIFMVRIWH